jgi:hypothetical protein
LTGYTTREVASVNTYNANLRSEWNGSLVDPFNPILSPQNFRGGATNYPSTVSIADYNDKTSEAGVIILSVLALVLGAAAAAQFGMDPVSDGAEAADIGALEETAGAGGEGVINLADMTPDDISQLSREQIRNNLPSGWKYYENNGFTQIKDQNGVTRVRIDPPSKNGNPDYTHMHVYNQEGQPLDKNGEVVNRKSPAAHLPYNK